MRSDSLRDETLPRLTIERRRTWFTHGRVYHDGFDSQDYCKQEFSTWPECWQEIGESDGPEDGGARIRRAKLRLSHHARGVSRRLRLANVDQAWVRCLQPP